MGKILGRKSETLSHLHFTHRTIKQTKTLIQWVPHFSLILGEVGILTSLCQKLSSSIRCNRARNTTLFFVAAGLLSAAATAQAQVRDPTPAEKKVIEQYTSVIHPFLDTFESDDWNTKVDFDVDDNVLVGQSNDYPLDVDELIQRSYTVKNGSPLYQREVAPFLAKMQQMSPTEMAQAGKKLKMLRLEVQVHFNRAAADKDARTKQQLQVPGAAYSYVTEQSEDKRSQTVVLLFGDWKSAQQGSDDLKFQFKHPPHTPVVENIVVQLQGSPDRIRELLQRADWKRVNQALIGAGS